MSRTVLIRGGTLEAWAASLYMKRKLKGLVGEVLVTPEAGEKTSSSAALVVRPRTRAFLSALGLSEEVLFGHCDASFLLGARVDGPNPFILAWGAYGAPANSVAFHHYWKRMADAGQAAPYDQYALGAELARTGRFVHPAPDPKKIESSFDYGYTLDAAAFRELLRSEAVAAGVQEIAVDEGEAWLSLDMRHSSGAGWIQWPDLPGRFSVNEESLDTPAENLSVYDISPEPDAIALSMHTRSHTVRRDIVIANEGELICGRAEAPWRDRQIAMGPAACCLPGLHAPGFMLLHAHLDLLVSLLPTEDAPLAPVAAEYNRRAVRMMDHAADFEALALSGHRARTDFVSPALARKTGQFLSRGRIVTYDDELHSEQEWISALIAAGLIPERVSPLALGAPLEAVQRNYDGLRRAIGQAATRLPRQQHYLDHLLTTTEDAPNAV